MESWANVANFSTLYIFVEKIAPASLELAAVKNPAGIKAFGAHLRRLREGRGMSQRELADYADVAMMTVHRIETAQSSPTLDVLLSLARVLQLPVYELVKGPGIDTAG